MAKFIVIKYQIDNTAILEAKVKIKLCRDQFNIWRWRHEPGKSLGQTEAKVLEVPPEGELLWFGGTIKFEKPLIIKKSKPYWMVLDWGNHQLANRIDGDGSILTMAEVKMQGYVP
jgi:hypothetical protein